MKKNCKNFNNIKEVLCALTEQPVTILLGSCQKLNVVVEAVVDDLLVASVCNKIIFINIDCICAVVTCCEEILEFLLQSNRGCGKYKEEGSKKHDKLFTDSDSLTHEIVDCDTNCSDKY